MLIASSLAEASSSSKKTKSSSLCKLLLSIYIKLAIILRPLERILQAICYVSLDRRRLKIGILYHDKTFSFEIVLVELSLIAMNAAVIAKVNHRGYAAE